MSATAVFDIFARIEKLSSDDRSLLDRLLGRLEPSVRPREAAAARGEDQEAAALAALASRGLVIAPQTAAPKSYHAPLVPDRGKPASRMVIEDRR